MNFIKKIPIWVLNFLYPSKIYNAENMPSGGAVILCNHFSAFDFIYPMKASKEDVVILGKKEIFNNKLFGKILKSYNVIPVDRENVEVNTIISALKALKRGRKLVIFPEGTRNKTGSNELQVLKGGASIFAIKAKKKVVPMMLLNKPKLFIKTKIIVGEPFELTEFYDLKLNEEIIEKTNNIISEKMKEQYEILLTKISK